jgi:hypothetical protein
MRLERRSRHLTGKRAKRLVSEIDRLFHVLRDPFSHYFIIILKKIEFIYICQLNYFLSRRKEFCDVWQ